VRRGYQAQDLALPDVLGEVIALSVEASAGRAQRETARDDPRQRAAPRQVGPPDCELA
jgi:hypothetical protein